VLFAAGAIEGVLGEPMANLLKLAVTLSMAAPSLLLLAAKDRHREHVLVPSSGFAGHFDTGVKSSVSSPRLLNDTKLG
jgi:hypothetical protein